MIRLLAIALIGLGALLAFLATFAFVLPNTLPDTLALILCVFSLVFGVWLGFRLFPSRSRIKPGQTIAELKAQGLIETEEYHIERCFEVAEFEDEGLHFFLELTDGRVLCLIGQYLYDYIEITDDPDVAQPASFPCRHFKIHRHKIERWVYQIEPLSPHCKPEVELPHYGQAFIKKFQMPEDGKIYTESYEVLKQSISAR